jgi:DtxR family Mn-dependent transcriptional regulator
VNDRTLVDLDPVLRCRLSRVRTHDVDKLRYFADLGLVPGVEIELSSRAPFNGPLRIRTQKEELVLGYDLASALYVEPLETQPN